MPFNLAALSYALGSPGMIGTHGYKHNRQHVLDTFFVNTTAKNMYYGTAAVLRADVIDTAEGTVPTKILGVFQDPEKYNRAFYSPKDKVVITTMGDIWVRVPTALTIKVMDNVAILATTNLVDGVAVPGFFTNAAPGAAGVAPYAFPMARFLTPNINGLALIGIDTWQGAVPT